MSSRLLLLLIPNRSYLLAFPARTSGLRVPLSRNLCSQINGSAKCKYLPLEQNFNTYAMLITKSDFTDSTLFFTHSPRRPEDVNGVATEPRTFSEFTIPTSPPYLIGSFCYQYVWQDTVANQVFLTRPHRRASAHPCPSPVQVYTTRATVSNRPYETEPRSRGGPASPAAGPRRDRGSVALRRSADSADRGAVAVSEHRQHRLPMLRSAAALRPARPGPVRSV